MAQWINVYQNNSFINLSQLHLLCKKSGAIHLVQLGLMTGCQVDEMQINFDFLKFAIDFLIYLVKLLHCYSGMNAFKLVFLVCFKVVVRSVKNLEA